MATHTNSASLSQPRTALSCATSRPFVRDLMRQMEQDLDTKLDWVAVDHFNSGTRTHISSSEVAITAAGISSWRETTLGMGTEVNCRAEDRIGYVRMIHCVKRRTLGSAWCSCFGMQRHAFLRPAAKWPRPGPTARLRAARPSPAIERPGKSRSKASGGSRHMRVTLCRAPHK
jgi:hypothetical protein